MRILPVLFAALLCPPWAQAEPLDYDTLRPRVAMHCIPQAVRNAWFSCDLLLSHPDIPTPPLVRLGELLEHASLHALYIGDRKWAAVLMARWELALELPKDAKPFGLRLAGALARRLDLCAAGQPGTCRIPGETHLLMTQSVIMVQRLHPRDRALWWWFGNLGV